VTTATTSEQQHDLDRERGTYVYGVVAFADDLLPAGTTGLEQAPVRLVRHDAVAAVVSDLPLDRPPGRAADLVAHSEVLDSLAGRTAVVPVHFGSVLADDSMVVEDVLAPGYDEFVHLLEELEGRVQLILRATYVQEAVLAEVVAADPEVAALRERTRDLPEDAAYGDRVRLGELVSRAMEVKREDDAATLMDAVTPWVAAWSERGGAGGLDHVLDVALLVDNVNLAAVEEHLEGLAEAVHERIRLRLVGPVAPYDFVGGAGWA
jgi:hypothetical protein